MQSVSPLISLASKRLAGKVAVITGGASGIGECTAKLFSQHGAKVVIADIQDNRGTSLCRSIGPDVASYFHCDVTDESNVSALVDHAISKHGKLDIMFSNAGIGGLPNPRILETEKTEFERVVAVNLTGSFLCTKHAARAMVLAGAGSIVVTASVASIMGALTMYPYTASKHAVRGLVKDAAVELGRHGIRVNCVSPLTMATPLVKGLVGNLAEEEIEEEIRKKAVLKGPTLKVDDVANAVLFLASDESKYVSGLNLVVDGGFTVTNSVGCGIN